MRVAPMVLGVFMEQVPSAYESVSQPKFSELIIDADHAAPPSNINANGNGSGTKLLSPVPAMNPRVDRLWLEVRRTKAARRSFYVLRRSL
jgi:hypothetical protein